MQLHLRNEGENKMTVNEHVLDLIKIIQRIKDVSKPKDGVALMTWNQIDRDLHNLKREVEYDLHKG